LSFSYFHYELQLGQSAYQWSPQLDFGSQVDMIRFCFTTVAIKCSLWGALCGELCLSFREYLTTEFCFYVIIFWMDTASRQSDIVGLTALLEAGADIEYCNVFLVRF
jgi:hypothetical protein